MHRRVEVSKTKGHDFKGGTGLTFDGDIRTTLVTYATVISIKGRGKNRFAQVLTRDLQSAKIKVPGGVLARSGEKYACLDLDHPLEGSRGFIPAEGTEVAFEQVDLDGVNELWTLTEYLKIVGSAKSPGEIVQRHRSPTAPIAAHSNLVICICNRIDAGDLPDDGIEIMREQGWLEFPEVRAKLDQYGIPY